MNVSKLVHALNKEYAVSDSNGEYKGANPTRIKTVKQLALLKIELQDLYVGSDIVFVFSPKTYGIFSTFENTDNFFVYDYCDNNSFADGRKIGMIFGSDVRLVQQCDAVVAVAGHTIVGYREVTIKEKWWVKTQSVLGEILADFLKIF